MAFSGKRARALREALNQSRGWLAEKMNTTSGTIANWELDRSNPNDEQIPLLADFLGTTTDYLLGRSEITRETSPPYAEHRARGEEAYPARPMTARIDLPVLGEVPAGPENLAAEYIEEYLPGNPRLVEDDPLGYYWLRVKGRSMSMDGISDRGLILVHRQEDVEDYQVAVLRIDGEEATVKKIKHLPGALQLIPAHPSMEVRELPASRVRIIGRVKLAQTEF